MSKLLLKVYSDFTLFLAPNLICFWSLLKLKIILVSEAFDTSHDLNKSLVFEWKVLQSTVFVISTPLLVTLLSNTIDFNPFSFERNSASAADLSGQIF